MDTYLGEGRSVELADGAELQLRGLGLRVEGTHCKQRVVRLGGAVHHKVPDHTVVLSIYIQSLLLLARPSEEKGRCW